MEKVFYIKRKGFYIKGKGFYIKGKGFHWLSVGGILLFLSVGGAIKKKLFEGRGNFFFMKSVHNSLIYIRRKFTSGWIKIEAARKQNPKKKHVFFRL